MDEFALFETAVARAVTLRALSGDPPDAIAADCGLTLEAVLAALASHGTLLSNGQYVMAHSEAARLKLTDEMIRDAGASRRATDFLAYREDSPVVIRAPSRRRRPGSRGVPL